MGFTKIAGGTDAGLLGLAMKNMVGQIELAANQEPDRLLGLTAS